MCLRFTFTMRAILKRKVELNLASRTVPLVSTLMTLSLPSLLQERFLLPLFENSKLLINKRLLFLFAVELGYINFATQDVTDLL